MMFPYQMREKGRSELIGRGWSPWSGIISLKIDLVGYGVPHDLEARHCSFP